MEPFEDKADLISFLASLIRPGRSNSICVLSLRLVKAGIANAHGLRSPKMDW
jgi:hypothetical protein